MNKKNILLLSLLFIYTLGYSQEQKTESYAFSLKQSIDYAYLNQTDVLNASLDEEIAQAKVREITGIGLPQISAGVDLKYFAKLPTSIIPLDAFPIPGMPPAPKGAFKEISFGTKYNMTPSIDVSQLIFDGSYLIGVKAAKVYMQLSQKNTEKSKIETASTITKAYFSVLINEEHAKLIDVNIERTKKLLSDSKALYENGFVEKIDLDRLSVLNNNLTSEKEKIQRMIELSYYLLKFQMGMDVSANLSLTDKLSEIDFKSVHIPYRKF
jgi:outer membrane protein